MTALATAALVVPFIDLAIKYVVVARLSNGSLSLGALGAVRPLRRQIWLMRARRQPALAVMWAIWVAAAAASLVLCTFAPELQWPLGLVLGGALSHAIETSLRGSVCDYVCLRFWPAFNAADVALTAGGLGVLVHVIGSVS